MFFSRYMPRSRIAGSYGSSIYSFLRNLHTALQTSLVAQWQRICLKCRRCRFDPRVGKIPWRRKLQPIPVFLPGKSHRQKSLAGYRQWGRQRVEHNLVTTTTSTYCSPWWLYQFTFPPTVWEGSLSSTPSPYCVPLDKSKMNL